MGDKSLTELGLVCFEWVCVLCHGVIVSVEVSFSSVLSTESVSSVLKVFSILEALGEQKEIGVSDLSQRLMMSKATTPSFAFA